MAKTNQQTVEYQLRGGLYAKVAQVLLFSFLVFLSIHIMRYDYNELLYLRIAQSISATLFVLEIFNSPRDIKGRLWHGHRYQSTACLLLFTAGASLIVRSLRDDLYFLDLIYVFGCIGVALTIVNRRFSIYTSGAVFYAVSAIFAWRMFKGWSPAEWLYQSQNHVSITLIGLASLYILHRYLRTGVIDLIPAAITLFFSCIALGRSGIISSGILFVGLIACKMTSKKGIYSLLIVSFPCLLAMAFYSEDIMKTVMRFVFPAIDRFASEGLTANARVLVFEYYMQKIDVWTFFVGSDIDFLSKSDAMLTSHNSYLAWHIGFGAGAFLLFGYCVIALTRMFFIRPVHFVILLATMLRGLTDETLLTTTFISGIPFVLALISEGVAPDKKAVVRKSKVDASPVPIFNLKRKPKIA